MVSRWRKDGLTTRAWPKILSLWEAREPDATQAGGAAEAFVEARAGAFGVSTVFGRLRSMCARSGVRWLRCGDVAAGIKSVVKGVDVVDVGVRLDWSRLARRGQDMGRDRDLGAIDIRQHGVDSRGLAVAVDEDGYVVEEETGMTGLAAALARLGGEDRMAGP